MYRVTTPTHTYTLPIETSTCKEILVTYKQNGITLDKHYENGVLPDGMALDGKNVIVKLTQAETKAFTATSAVHSQIRVLTNDDDAFASQTFTVLIGDVLNEEILADD